SALRAAVKGYVVGGSKGEPNAQGLEHVRWLAPRRGLVAALVRQLRPHQWSKNALLLVPVLLAAGVPRLDKLAIACLAALTFSLCASAGYVLNDLLDLDADRVHRSKRYRPFAAGDLPVIAGPPLFWGLLVVSFGLSLAFLVPQFTVLLALYLAGTLTYSLYLKRQLLVDVLVLAGLYTHRILAGGVATAIEVTTWLLGFSMFLFTSLAFAKRYVELHATESEDQVKNRGYFKTDLQMVTAMGTTSGYIAALVFVLYVDSAVVRSSYREPALLWLILPVLLYWLGRIWLLAGRGQMQDDPVKFAMKDKVSLWCGALMAVIVALARFTPDSFANLLSWQP
ncbi:MAG TPA: UbiA family prenyltransferase, partial [Polyangiaceae bacterium]|nr:UbiA family prenyltransferase [Polyangiaceae bacterium]